MATLKKYRQKRNLVQTPEPGGGRVSKKRQIYGGRFVVQLHAARRTHFDLRLEIEGALKSWAVPRGPSPNPKEKRLAVETEDHPIEYHEFEGVIPKENYGAGSMIVWDHGRWQQVEGSLAAGKIAFQLYGFKLKGKWALVKLKKGQNEWLLIKEIDAFVENDPHFNYAPQSVLSGLTVTELTKPRRQSSLRSAKKLKEQKRIEPMLATPVSTPPTGSKWIHELKYDGYRISLLKKEEEVQLYSRNGHDYTHLFPEIVLSARHLPIANCQLDGEVVVLDEEGKPSFRKLQQRSKLSRKNDIDFASLNSPSTFFCFDLPSLHKQDLRSFPLKKRRALLDKFVPLLGYIRRSETFKNGKALYSAAKDLILEGIVSKKLDSPYESRRSDSWVKVRIDRTDDFVVMGYTSKTKGQLGALHLAQYSPLQKRWTYCGKVGTGFTRKQADAIYNELSEVERPTPIVPLRDFSSKGSLIGSVWVEPVLVVEVRFKEKNDLLRHAVFISHRKDKPPKDCTIPLDALAPSPPLPPRKKIEFSNKEKAFWVEEGITKGDLLAYYKEISPFLLPYLQNRPVVLTRYPNGIDGKSFFQKDAPVFTPAWIQTLPVWSEHSEREIRYFLCNDLDSLLYVINLGSIPLHIWASHSPHIDKVDWCVIDLDPKEAPFKQVVQLALETKAICKKAKIPCFVKTTGSSGLHLLIPLFQKFDHEQSKVLAELIGGILVARHPKICTQVRNPKKREGKVYIDHLQNGHGKTIAAPFCVRPLPGAPVSMPLRWSEVNARLHPRQFTLKNALKRMKKLKRDPLQPILKEKFDLEKSLAILKKLL